jgi:dihydroflavonol-4-reductase
MPTLVTGSTGLLGNNVVRLLLERGESVRVLVRDNSDPRPLEGLKVEIARGDIREPDRVRDAVRGCNAVIHAAGYIHIGWSKLRTSREINVEGTRHVAEAARQAGVKMVHVSTVDTLGLGTREQPADEQTHSPGNVPCSYVVSKREAEQVIMTKVQQGLDAVIVNPGFMLGPWDWKPSSGRMLLEVAQRFTPVAPVGGCTLCDVRDVATGMLSALTHGTTGQQYILGGHCMSYLDLWRLFAEVAGSGKPWFRAGPLLRVFAGASGDLWTRITGREGDLNSAAIGMSSQFHYHRSDHAAAELGYRCSPAREAVESAWQWFCQYGYVNPRGK